jgi:dihydropteroate synthase
MTDAAHVWQVGDRTLAIRRRPLVMGIVNVTPDSFSDGGRYDAPEAAIAHGLALVEQGADLLDVGGESTRPGAEPVPLEEELRRILPVVEALAQQVPVPISVDTSKAEVARQCLDLGARVINDVTALSGDAEMTAVARTFGAGVILMHMQGTPATMQEAPRYDDVVADISRYLDHRYQEAVKAGVAPECLAVDPGIGFGKTRDHNLEILARLNEFGRLSRPVCLGVSRKGFLGRLLQRPVEERGPVSLAAVCFAVSRQAVQIVRVHDVAATCDAMTLLAAIDEFREKA